MDLGDECRDDDRLGVLDRPEVIEPISASPVKRLVEGRSTIRDASSFQSGFDEPRGAAGCNAIIARMWLNASGCLVIATTVALAPMQRLYSAVFMSLVSTRDFA
jgi:hypothetical protein